MAMALAARTVRTVAASTLPVRAMGTHAGTVKFFQRKKGFGFINPSDEPDKDVFVHQSDIVSDGFRFLVEGEAVEFDVTTTDRGLVATNVSGPDGAPLHHTRGDNGDEQMHYR